MSSRDEMAAVNGKYVAAVSRGDAAGIAALFTEEVIAMYSHRDFVKGRQEIQRFYQGFLDSGVKAVKLDTLELEEHGDTAYEVGIYTVFGVEGKTLDVGKYVLIWKREGDQWKYHRDIGVTSI